MNKLLSIIVPSYNMEGYLSKCLGSLIIDDKELLQKLDVIVVNDGSKDRTSEIAHEFEVKYPNVFRVIDKVNGNYGSCINVAIPVTEGKFVKVLDADDSFDGLAFARFLRFLDGCETDLIISDYVVVDENGVIAEHRTYDLPVDRAFALKELGRTSRYLSMHAYTYRTTVVRESKYKQLEGVSYSDTEWILLPLVNVCHITYCPEAVYRYLRGRAGQTMEHVQIARNFWMKAALVFDMLWQYKQVVPFASMEAINYIQPRLLTTIAGVYRGGIFGQNGYRVNLNLREFDKNLQRCAPEFYDQVSSEIFCHKIPYRYIDSWRRGAWFQPILVSLCKICVWVWGVKGLFFRERQRVSSLLLTI